MNIVHEILDYRTSELLAGREPKQINLSYEQKIRFQVWIKKAWPFSTPCPFQDQIFGMTTNFADEAVRNCNTNNTEEREHRGNAQVEPKEPK